MALLYDFGYTDPYDTELLSTILLHRILTLFLFCSAKGEGTSIWICIEQQLSAPNFELTYGFNIHMNNFSIQSLGNNSITSIRIPISQTVPSQAKDTSPDSNKKAAEKRNLCKNFIFKKRFLIEPGWIWKNKDMGFFWNEMNYITHNLFLFVPNGLRENHDSSRPCFGDRLKKKRFLKLIHRQLRVLLAVKKIAMAIKSLSISLNGFEIENKVIMQGHLK